MKVKKFINNPPMAKKITKEKENNIIYDKEFDSLQSKILKVYI